jgi:hypothetical protein
MLTTNADFHPMMQRMHISDITETWLKGAIEEASALIALTPVETFNASPAH